MEDSLSNTHLFYRIHYYTKDSVSLYEENNVYHLDLHNNSDTLKFPEYNHSYSVIYFDESKYVTDYKFWHNNPNYYIYGGYGGWCGYVYINRFDEYNTTSLGSGNIRLGISNENDSLVYSTFGVSTDGGRSWPMQPLNFHFLSPFNDQVMFLIDHYGGLLKSTDGGLTSYVVDTTKFFDDRSDFIFDKDSTHIYAVVRTPEWKWYCMVSNNKGEPGSWCKVFESNCKIILSYDYSGHLYLATANKLYYSGNYGSMFTQITYFNDNITGIYKKPNSTKIYITLPHCLFVLENFSIVNPIKIIPLDKQITFYDPIDNGNRWIYSRVEKASPTEPEMKYLEVKEVVKDTVINNHKCKKIASYYYNRYFHSPVTYTYEQIDSTTGYTYFSDDGISFYKGEELNFNVIYGEMSGSRYGIDSLTTLISDENVWYYSYLRQNKAFESSNLIPHTPSHTTLLMRWE